PNGVNQWTAEFYPHGAFSEDCLTVSVWAPKTVPAVGLPVIVWLPGGGLRDGGAAAPIYDRAALARKGVAVVLLTARVNALGFLVHPALRPEPDGGVGNYGLRDALAALKWVHANAAAFGGDPTRVTLGGQSAGGALANCLMAMPAARGLFSRAIL